MENPQERLQYYRETGQAEQARLYEQYLRETGQIHEPIAKAPAAVSDATRNAPRPDRGGDIQAILSGGQGKVIMNDVVPALGAHAINAAQSIPFMRNVQAGALAATSPMSYGESKTALDALTSEIPGDLRAAEQIATGALPYTKALNSTLVRRGATVTGAALRGGLSDLPVVRGAVRNVRRANRAWNAGKAATKAPSAIEGAAETVAPKVEGLTGNSMDDVLRAVKSYGADEGDGVIGVIRSKQPMYDAFSSEAQAADHAPGHSLPDVVKAAERYRTESGALQQRAPNARFDWFAERMAKRKQP